MGKQTALKKQEEVADTGTSGLLEPIGGQDLSKEGYSCDVFVVMEEGQELAGTFEGPGGDIALQPDEQTGEIRTIKSWRIRSAKNPNVVVVLGGRSQLDARLGVLRGGEDVVIQCGKVTPVRGGARQVRNWYVWTKVA